MNNNVVDKLNKKLKRQRIFIFILIICVPIAAYFTPQYFGINPVTDSEFPMLDPLRKFIAQDSYVINIQDLRNYLSDIGNKYPEYISIYYEQINSGANISINKDLHLFPASLSKLVQAILITKKVEDGIWAWDKTLKALPEDLSSDSGSLYQSIGDKPVTIDKLLEELLVNSDNTAQNIFRHYLDVPDYLKFQDETGLQDLYNEKGYISAKEYTRLLRVLYTSSYLKPENSEKILDLMSKVTFKDYLSQGIPSSVVFAHKYGENKQESIFADSGIVYIPGKPFMISVMIKGKDSTDATRAWAVGLMKEISEHVYNASK
jgi:beta-lactamase class A